eukprot:4336443-Alexandrium_andersonii.AAC.1
MPQPRATRHRDALWSAAGSAHRRTEQQQAGIATSMRILGHRADAQELGPATQALGQVEGGCSKAALDFRPLLQWVEELMK